LYITKSPFPFTNKVPQRTAEQDAAEAERNRNWDPNAPLAGTGAARRARGVVTAPPRGAGVGARVAVAAPASGTAPAKASPRADAPPAA
ncbi:hypothetical protein ABTK30_20075, partial [Acinetobacter baumannii]